MEENYRYGIQFVSKITGINSHTVRAWENRYNAITPMRDKNKRRLYSNEQIKRLKALKGLVDFGNSISDIAGLPDEELLNMLDMFVPSTKQKIQKENEIDTNEVLHNCKMGIQWKKLGILEHEINKTYDLDSNILIEKIVQPLMEHIQENKKTINDEYFTNMVATTINDALMTKYFKDMNNTYENKMVVCSVGNNFAQNLALQTALLSQSMGIGVKLALNCHDLKFLNYMAKQNDVKKIFISVGYDVNGNRNMYEQIYQKFYRNLTESIDLGVGVILGSYDNVNFQAIENFKQLRSAGLLKKELMHV